MRKALVVDDSRTMRGILDSVLQEMGFSVSEARDGQEAWELLSAGASYEVALLDWNMPRMDGLELLKNIRADHRFDPMLVVMVTTEGEISKVTTILQSGANGYVVKPFQVDSVVDQLKALGL
jgi:two-component system chemotaxis response regulator CheY